MLPKEKYVFKSKLFVIIIMAFLIVNQDYSRAATPLIFDSPVSADSSMSAANLHYMNHEYDVAAQYYTSLLAAGYESKELYYNLGNAYFKQDKLAEAILYYEKALLLDPRDEDIRQNLSIANTRIIDKIDSIPVFFLRRWTSYIQDFFTPDQWAVISLVLFFLALIGFAWFVIGRNFSVKKTGFSSGVVLLLLSIIGLLFTRGRMHDLIQKNTVIIMAPQVNVKSSPDEQSANVFILHAGTKATVTDSVQNWKEVKIADGNKGWISGEVLGEI